MISVSDAPQGEVLDREALLARVDGDQELLGELVELFLDSYPELLTMLRDSIAQGEPTQVRFSAHALKGSIANFSAPAAVNAALRLEHMGRAGELTDAQVVYVALEQELKRLRCALLELTPAVATRRDC